MNTALLMMFPAENPTNDAFAGPFTGAADAAVAGTSTPSDRAAAATSAVRIRLMWGDFCGRRERLDM
ncbi:hypothetical protein [Microbacterium sp. NPDC057741]|uniref:hypothetical protein n=1 Tax=Microbacterium sp. NPDC057741 TaxID=3346235 RepID=UPI00366E37D6